MSATILFVGPGTELLAVTLFSYSQAGRFQIVSALAIVLMVINITGIGGGTRLGAFGEAARFLETPWGGAVVPMRKRLGLLLTIVAVALAACNPPLAATPTAAPPRPPTDRRPRRKPTTAPAAAPTAAAAAKPTTAPAAQRRRPAAAAAASPPTLPGDCRQVLRGRQEGRQAGAVRRRQLDALQPGRDAFQKHFPGIELVGVDQRGRESREKVFAEQQSKNYVADVVISGTDTQNELVQNGLHRAFQAS